MRNHLKISLENKKLFSLFWPILIEQALTILVGMVSTILVSNVGDYAVAGVNLVDTINQLIIILFNSLAVGASVMVAQHIGAGRNGQAGQTAAQSIVLVVGASILLGGAAFIFAEPLLNLLYGSAADNVLQVGVIYMRFSAISYIFLALFSISAGVTRAAGNSRTPMMAALLSNLVNISIAAVLIYIFHLEVYAVSIAVLAARMVSGLFMFLTVRRVKSGPLLLPPLRLKLDLKLLRPVLNIGVPSGVDNLIFQGAKVLISVFIAGMGTAALQANAICNSAGGYIWLAGNAMQVAAVTMVGQAYGARLFHTAKQWMRKLSFYTAGIQVILLLPYLLVLKGLISFYGASAASAALAQKILMICAIVQPFIYAWAFVLPQCLRATGDARFTMVVSVISLIGLRLSVGWFLGIYLGWGVFGIWMGMLADWLGRAIGFIWRLEKNKWHGGKVPLDEGILEVRQNPVPQ
ncbi:MAG TPA: MATE family efflux transporter [Bacillota bacterium]|nr:MATE family efflux transporter [Bacillota bacterium]